MGETVFPIVKDPRYPKVRDSDGQMSSTGNPHERNHGVQGIPSLPVFQLVLYTLKYPGKKNHSPLASSARPPANSLQNFPCAESRLRTVPVGNRET
jgi:hypothetical protein